MLVPAQSSLFYPENRQDLINPWIPARIFRDGANRPDIRLRRRILIQQAMLLESAMYKRAGTMEAYNDKETLRDRIIYMIAYLLRIQYPDIFKYYRL